MPIEFRGTGSGQEEVITGRAFAPEASSPSGDILFARETSPDDYPLMVAAKAVVTCRGGLLSHAAIVCMEMDKPFVVGVGGLLDWQSAVSQGKGVMLTVNPASGTVTIVEE